MLCWNEFPKNYIYLIHFFMWMDSLMASHNSSSEDCFQFWRVLDIGLNLRSTNAKPDLSFSFQIFPFNSRHLIKSRYKLSNYQTVKVVLAEYQANGRTNHDWHTHDNALFRIHFLLSVAPENFTLLRINLLVA